MKHLRFTSQFKKDLKRYQHSVRKIDKLSEILRLLRDEEDILQKFKLHVLTGDYQGCLECHIESDFLVIWIDEQSETIALLRLGSHAELFGKGVKR